MFSYLRAPQASLPSDLLSFLKQVGWFAIHPRYTWNIEVWLKDQEEMIVRCIDNDVYVCYSETRREYYRVRMLYQGKVYQELDIPIIDHPTLLSSCTTTTITTITSTTTTTTTTNQEEKQDEEEEESYTFISSSSETISIIEVD